VPENRSDHIASDTSLDCAGLLASLSDSQGAIIPGAKVGQVLFPLISVGSYRIVVEKPGFKKFENSGVQLRMNDNLKLDSSAALKETVDSKRVVELPLNGRNLADLTLPRILQFGLRVDF
jgi:hypothetical protein